MKPKFQILSFFLSVMVLLSPFLLYASTERVENLKIEEMSCCVLGDSEVTQEHACCPVDVETSNNHHEKGDNSCDDNKCHPRTCHSNVVNGLNFFSIELPFYKNEIILSTKELKSDAYQFFLIKDLASSSWKPPKFIS